MREHVEDIPRCCHANKLKKMNRNIEKNGFFTLDGSGRVDKLKKRCDKRCDKG